MGTFFDDSAKASAERHPGVAGLTRRHLIQRGALVVGTAWTAPMLLSTTPAWAGASVCANQPGTVYSVCGDNTTRCCAPSIPACVLNITTNHYECGVPLGGNCGNNGDGVCNGGLNRCNHLATYSICGGAGALCDFNNAGVCAPGVVCAPTLGVKGSRCGGVGAPCTTSTECANGSTGGAVNLTCVSGFCA